MLPTSSEERLQKSALQPAMVVEQTKIMHSDVINDNSED